MFHTINHCWVAPVVSDSPVMEFDQSRRNMMKNYVVTLRVDGELHYASIRLRPRLEHLATEPETVVDHLLKLVLASTTRFGN